MTQDNWNLILFRHITAPVHGKQQQSIWNSTKRYNYTLNDPVYAGHLQHIIVINQEWVSVKY